MLISKQDLIEIFQAADLDSEKESIKLFLESYEYPIHKSGKARYIFLEDLFQILKKTKEQFILETYLMQVYQKSGSISTKSVNWHIKLNFSAGFDP